VGSASVKAYGSKKNINSSSAEMSSRLSSTAKYRVSLSLNLKGEWMDTSSAGFGCPTYPTTENK
jgi:hypothetical protein